MIINDVFIPFKISISKTHTARYNLLLYLCIWEPQATEGQIYWVRIKGFMWNERLFTDPFSISLT